MNEKIAKMKKKLSFWALNLGLLFFNMLIFMNVITGQSALLETPLKGALRITALFMSVIILVVGNVSLGKKAKPKFGYTLSELDTRDEFVQALQSYQNKKVFSSIISSAIAQMDRLERKSKSLNVVLTQNYSEGIEGFAGLSMVEEETRNYIFENMKKLLNAMSVFDNVEYERLRVVANSDQNAGKNMSVYQNHLKYTRQLIDRNEAVLLEFDKLLIETSKMSDKAEQKNAVASMQDIIASMQELRKADLDVENALSQYNIRTSESAYKIM